MSNAPIPGVASGSSPATEPARLPVFINPDSGSAATTLPILQQDSRLYVHALPAGDMEHSIRKVIRAGATRIAVAGGDGTIALAGNLIAGTPVELAIIPGGTLNHFAARLGIPSDTQNAIEVALQGIPQTVGAGYVNDRLFINTSSVGAYVRFVRTRDHLQRRIGYHLASLLAGLRRLLRWENASIRLDNQKLLTPLVFVGVGERELVYPTLGQTPAGGAKDGLHLIALRSNGPLSTLKLAINAMLRGIDPLSRSKQLEERVTDKLELRYRRHRRYITVALDGELALMQPPLQYRYVEAALSVIIPPADSSGPPAAVR